MTVHTPLLGLIWHVLESRDIDPSTAIPADLYRPGSILGSRSRVSFAVYQDAVVRALALIDDDAPGLLAAQQIHPNHLGVFGFAWLACPSLASCFAMLQRYSRAFLGPLEVRLHESPTSIRVTFTMSEPGRIPDVDADAHTGGLVRFCRFHYGDSFMPESVSLRRPQPQDDHRWTKHFGVTVNFSSDEDSVTVAKTVADQILTGGNSAIFDMHNDELARLMTQFDQNDIVSHVRTAIIQLLPSAGASEASVAKIANINARTLHRKLSEKGETFRSVLKDVRKSAARQYISDHQYNITEIAFMLGYSDTSAFSRAFKQWFGDTPTEIRRAASMIR